MFRVHKIWSNNLSVKNLVLLFFTIVLWFASVITLAQIDIPSSIDNAWQTIARITITASGTDSTPLIEMSWTGIHIDNSVLNDWGNFSGKILGIDENGDVIYVWSYNLVGSWWSGMSGDDGDWTKTGNNIYATLPGNVGIGTDTPTGKLHIVSSWETDVYIQEQAAGMAASLRLVPPLGPTWIVWWDSVPNIFFIGTIGHQEYFAMNTWGRVGIGTITPKASLQVSGNFIAWSTLNSISWNNSSIWWGWNMVYENIINGNFSFIWWWIDARIYWDYGFIWWWRNNILWGNYAVLIGGSSNSVNGPWSVIIWWDVNHLTWQNSSILWWYHNSIMWNYSVVGWVNNSISWNISIIAGWANNSITWDYSFIWWGVENKIHWGKTNFIWGGWYNWLGNIISWANFSSIVWWTSNKIYTATNAFIGWGYFNVITWNSNYSTIPGWFYNTINNAINSFAAWVRAKANYNNSFVWNSDVAKDFSSEKPNTFIINAPGGVWIGTGNPQWDLYVAWNGLLVLKPLHTNTNGCSIQWAIHYNNKWSTTGGYLCYCDGVYRRQIQDNTLFCI